MFSHDSPVTSQEDVFFLARKRAPKTRPNTWPPSPASWVAFRPDRLQKEQGLGLMSQWESHHPTKKGISIPTDIYIYICWLVMWNQSPIVGKNQSQALKNQRPQESFEHLWTLLKYEAINIYEPFSTKQCLFLSESRENPQKYVGSSPYFYELLNGYLKGPFLKQSQPKWFVWTYVIGISSWNQTVCHEKLPQNL